ncbi:MAG: hypothetical protein HC835_09950 [Oscillatoriales cyanobacterium RM2_1_1]|nr:hypothetical protein [Oscillatoriales cyanobacterium SM2_3_0]NJO45922.1 hypothetical protein [Oscillatoriales cyanobacterium RM2_1_1]
MNQATAFVGGCLFTILTALLLLIVWLMFGEMPKRGQAEILQLNPGTQGMLPPPPQPGSSYGLIPLNPPSPGQSSYPYPTSPFNPALPPPPPVANGESGNNSPEKSQGDQQNLTQQLTGQLTTQVDQQRIQTEQLRSQMEQSKAQVDQLSTQFEQQRIRTEQLMLQLQEQQRLIMSLNGPQQMNASSQSSTTLQSAVLWTLVGVVVALFLGGGVLVLSVIALIAQPQRRVLKRYPVQSIGVPWVYDTYEEPTELLPPHFKIKRSR